MKSSRSNFTSRIGFILSAAGSAVGLGNIWRFPYLAAQYGGGTFLLCYIILAVTFGFALMTAEIALGRKTGLSAIGAFSALNKRYRFVGVLVTLVPVIIFPYYSGADVHHPSEGLCQHPVRWIFRHGLLCTCIFCGDHLRHLPDGNHRIHPDGLFPLVPPQNQHPGVYLFPAHGRSLFPGIRDLGFRQAPGHVYPGCMGLHQQQHPDADCGAADLFFCRVCHQAQGHH